MKTIFLSVIALFSITYTFAQDEKHPIDVKLDKCIDKDPSTMGMNMCTDQAMKDWDKQMNTDYQAYMKLLDKKQQEILKQSQRSWLTYRDNEFKNIEMVYSNIYDKAGGGTMYSTIAAGAKLEVVKSRALEINSYLSNTKEFAGE